MTSPKIVPAAGSAPVGAALACALLFTTAMAWAQDATPDMETKTFGSWTMRYVQRADPLPPCDIVQGVSNRDTGKQLMQASFAYLSDKDQYAVQLVLPLGFLITSGVLIRIEGGPDITDWPVTHCEPTGCVVERLVAAPVLAPFRDHDKAVVAVLDRQGKAVAFPLALNGYAAAANAMTARNRAAAKKK